MTTKKSGFLLQEWAIKLLHKKKKSQWELIYNRGSFYEFREMTIGLLSPEPKIELLQNPATRLPIHPIHHTFDYSDISKIRRNFSCMERSVICPSLQITDVYNPSWYCPLFFHTHKNMFQIFEIISYWLNNDLGFVHFLMQIGNEHRTANVWCQTPPLVPCALPCL